MRLLILHDDVAGSRRPDEADTMEQVRFVSEIAASLGHKVSALAATLRLDQLQKELECRQPDVVFNLVESLDSRGALIHLAPSIVESMRFPMTGSPAMAIHTTSSKLAAKTMMRSADLPTPRWICADDDSDLPIQGRWIIKSVWEHASIGLDDSSIVDAHCPQELRESIEARRDALGGEAFAEAFIDGREFNVSILEIDGEPIVLPPAEIDFSGLADERERIVGYRAKWDAESAEFRDTPRRFVSQFAEPRLMQTLNDLTIQCWRLFRLRGYARVDFRIGADQRPTILEVNVNPCLSPDAGFLAAAAHAGLAESDVIRHILAAAHQPLTLAR